MGVVIGDRDFAQGGWRLEIHVSIRRFFQDQVLWEELIGWRSDCRVRQSS
jgi:hypothetical protein